jgi:hypothetical protein
MKYFALSNIAHDGKNYGRGDAIDLSDKAAEDLLEAGVIQTEEVADVPAPAAPAPADDAPAEPKAGGERSESGEPSLDHQDAAQRTEAVDVTPIVSESMTRKELEDVAETVGISEAQMESAKTKADLVELINERRTAVEKPAPAESEVDASVDL